VCVRDVAGPRVDRDPEVAAVAAPEALVSLIPPPPQAVRPRPTTAARANSRVRADPRPMMLFLFSFRSATRRGEAVLAALSGLQASGVVTVPSPPGPAAA